MKIGFYGGARTVTGSRHLVSVNGRNILLDCGIFQGRRREMIRRNTGFPFCPKDVHAVILSHAHIDHSGNLPNLVKQGFRGKIHATPATIGLARYMLRDSARIQESDASYWNRRRAKQGKPPVDPLYTLEDAEAVLELFVAHSYGEDFPVAPGVRATFSVAGHILGAAVTVLQIEEDDRKIRLGFSGDLGRKNIPLLRDPEPVQDLDYLILESTYGDRRHEAPEVAYAKLKEVAFRCCGSQGKLIIPSFAVGRAQDLVYNFHRMMDEGEIERLPIYVDSPMATHITRVFCEFRDRFDREAQAFMANDAHEGALFFPEVTYVVSAEESKALNRTDEAMIIISPSGMVTAGRILHHLRYNIEDPRHTILLVSFSAPHTLGRRLVERQPTVKIFGEEYKVRARIEVINGFSGHADRDGLIDYVRPLAESLRGVFLVHGEQRSAFALREGLLDVGVRNVGVPELNEVVEI